MTTAVLEAPATEPAPLAPENRPNWDTLPETMTVDDINEMIAMWIDRDLIYAAMEKATTSLSLSVTPSLWKAADDELKPGARCGDAILVGQYVDGSPEWHEARKGGIGGSEIAAILGHSGWKSKHTLWCEKTGRAEAGDIDPMFAEWGHRLEPVILQKFQEKHPDKVLYIGGSFINKDRTWHKANPDGRVASKVGGPIDEIFEAKTSMSGSGWGPEWEGERGVPQKYLDQVRYYLRCFGFRKATIAVLIGLGDYREYEVYSSPFEDAAMIQAGAEFMQSIADDVEPPLDGHESTYNYLRGANPSIDTKLDVEIPAEIYEQAMEAKAAAEDAEAVLLLWKSHVMAHMGVAKVGYISVQDGDKVEKKPVATRMRKGKGLPYVQFK